MVLRPRGAGAGAGPPAAGRAARRPPRRSPPRGPVRRPQGWLRTRGWPSARPRTWRRCPAPRSAPPGSSHHEPARRLLGTGGAISSWTVITDSSVCGAADWYVPARWRPGPGALVRVGGDRRPQPVGHGRDRRGHDGDRHRDGTARGRLVGTRPAPGALTALAPRFGTFAPAWRNELAAWPLSRGLPAGGSAGSRGG